MLFCPKCGSLMKPKEEKGKRVMVCSNSKCNYVHRDVKSMKLKEIMINTDKEISVVSDEEAELLPLTDADCPKCDHNKAHYWLVQTRAGDEPETKFLKCEKCGYTWRDYS